MNLSSRSKLSLCQLLTLYTRDFLTLVLGKFGISTQELASHEQPISVSIQNAIFTASASQLSDLIEEFSRTRSSMRFEITPRYRFDERWEDLKLCIKLDGYALLRDEYGRELDRFVPIEPLIEGVESVEDDLAKEIRQSRPSEAEEIVRLLDNSAGAFRKGDYNGCLSSARVALQALATGIAKTRKSNTPNKFDESKWGQVAAYLRTSGLITKKQEEGLTGVYSFISPGTHIPVGFNEQ